MAGAPGGEGRGEGGRGEGLASGGVPPHAVLVKEVDTRKGSPRGL